MKILQAIRERFGSKPSGFDFSAAAANYGRRLVREWSQVRVPEVRDGKPIGVLVSPWLFTSAPFFMIEVALQLRLSGRPVLLLWEAGNVFVNAAKPREVAAIRPLLDRLPPWIPWLDVDTLPDGSRETPDFLDELLFENAVRHLKAESGAREFLAEHPEWQENMSRQCRRVEAFLSSERVASLCIPGGVWASSGIWLRTAARQGLPFTTYDSGAGRLVVSQNSVAAHFGDIRPALERIREGDTSHLVEKAREALRVRMEGRDPFVLQRAPRTGNHKAFDILIPLNLRFDSAALCRQRLFGSVTEWLHSVLKWASSRPGTTVAIRQHPCERLDGFRGEDSWETILAEFLRPGSGVTFFPAEADVNSYDLIGAARVVLPFTSRVGIEAAMMGKPVVTSAHCYYDGCGFVSSPQTREEYFELIGAALAGALVPDAEARRLAAVAYYLMEYCTLLATNFTPQPADYADWMAVPPADLANHDALGLVLPALACERPLTQAMHEQFTRTR